MYLSAFVVTPAMLVHYALYHASDTLKRWRGLPVDADDIHARMMRKYPAAPAWWFASIVVACAIGLLVAVKVNCLFVDYLFDVSNTSPSD